MPRLANSRARADPTPATADTGESRPLCSPVPAAGVVEDLETDAGIGSGIGTGAVSGVAFVPMDVPPQTLCHPTDPGQSCNRQKWKWGQFLILATTRNRKDGMGNGSPGHPWKMGSVLDIGYYS